MNNSKRQLSRSDKQQAVEQVVLQKFDAKATKKRFYFDEDKKSEFLEVDDYLEKPQTFIEIWSHVGKPKSAQKNKVMTDAAKLLFAETIFGKAKKVLLFVDEEVLNYFKGKNWCARFLKKFGFQLQKIEIEDELKKEILATQKGQDIRNNNF